MRAAAGRANDELQKLAFLIDPTNALRIPDALLIVNISTTHNFYSILPPSTPQAMHELLLYGQVPRSRHDQVLKILAGVAAMQPRRILQRHIVYKPTREPDEPGLNMRRGGTQAVAVKQTKPTAAKDLNFSQLVQKLVEEDFGNRNNGSALMAGGQVGGESKWALEFHDTPDTGDRGVLARLTQVTDITSGDPHAYMVADKNQ